MHNLDLEIPTSHLVFATRLSDGATFSDVKFGNFSARMTAEGYINFSEDNQEGPYTILQLNFLPCLPRYFNRLSITMDYHRTWHCEQSLNKKPSDLLKNHELLIPFVHRLASTALLLEHLPNMLPDAYPKLQGVFPLELTSDLNLFLQDPGYNTSTLISKYGINIGAFANNPENSGQYRGKISHIHAYLKEILESY